MTRTERGENYTIDIGDGQVYVRVFKREDVGHAEGAEFAQSLARRMVALSRAPGDEVRYAIMDLRHAPMIAGPVTMSAMGEMLEAWETAGLRIAIAVGDEAIRAVQYRTLAARHAPRFARVVEDVAAATAWCAG